MNTYKYTLTTSLSYSFIKDFFAQVTPADDTNKNFITTRNVASQAVWNLSVSYPFSLKNGMMYLLMYLLQSILTTDIKTYNLV
ncbi:hypothetical protein ACNQGB_06095 [Flavobacterium sp. XS1P32]|uniref:hypothetical protein n=1 Tax=unclassified Flavobacterium TaxID=196869 RepID=UPI003AAF58E4